VPFQYSYVGTIYLSFSQNGIPLSFYWNNHGNLGIRIGLFTSTRTFKIPNFYLQPDGQITTNDMNAEFELDLKLRDIVYDPNPTDIAGYFNEKYKYEEAKRDKDNLKYFDNTYGYVKILAPTADSRIYYSLDGNDPFIWRIGEDLSKTGKAGIFSI